MFKVLQPTRLAGLELRNRFVRSATFDAMADDTGAVTDRSLKLYGDLAAGGVGLIFTGYAFVSKQGQTRRQQYGIHCDEMIPGLKNLARAVQQDGAKIAVQIVHGGGWSRHLAREGKVAIAPSVIEGTQLCREMTEDEIEGVLGEFAAAALRAREAGFDGVQLHGAHGFLFSQFLSPLTNRRQDSWGGRAENRWRFHVEAVRRVKTAVGRDFPVMMK
ncbi:MAG: NADH:flavin oxidoreductase, partial [Dehalococcoidia bacterium]|nr:NADH:flavin oxidoreductase [Dehalococcoidia bacterium]